MALPDESYILDGMICPLSGLLMTDPIVLEDGYSYNRTSIESWFNVQTASKVYFSPVTGHPLSLPLIQIPNHNLRRTVQDLLRRVPNLLLSPRMQSSNQIVLQPVLQARVSQSQQSVSVNPAMDHYQLQKKEAPYILSTCFGFFGSDTPLIGTAVDVKAYITGQRRTTLPPSTSSPTPRWVDFVLMVSTPLMVRSCEYYQPDDQTSAHLCSFEVLETATAVMGPCIGFVNVNPLQFSASRNVVLSRSSHESLMDNLEALFETHGYYIDGSGWFRKPSGDTQQTGWYPGRLRKNDIVSIMAASKTSEIIIAVNNHNVCRIKLLPEEICNRYLWAFISLHGTVTAIRLIDRL